MGIVGLGLIIGIWTIVDSVIPDSVSKIESSQNKLLLVDEQREQVTDYSLSKVTCKSSLSHLFGGDRGPSYESNPLIPDRVAKDLSILGSLNDTVVIDSRLKGLDVQYYFRYQENFEESRFVILLHDLDETPSTYLGGDSTVAEDFFESGYNLVAPFIYSDSEWIQSTNYQLSLSGKSLDWVIISKVQSVMDFLDYQYNDDIRGSYTIYGKGWGSIIGRGTASVDDRIKLVISEDFSGDPIRDFVNSKISGFVPSVFLGLDKGECNSGSLQSFIDLVPTPHILVNSIGLSEYVDELSIVVNKEYEKFGDTRLLLLDKAESLMDEIKEIETITREIVEVLP